MAPSHSRQLLVWTLPTIAVLLSYLWYKKKRIGAQSDPGDKHQIPIELPAEPTTPVTVTPNKVEPEHTTPNRSFSRSLSGVETTPIDIVIPRELRSTKSNPLVISDEDLDLEIEKIKSMKNQDKKSPKTSPSNLTKTISPKINSSPEKFDIKIEIPKKQSPTKMAQKDIAVVEEKLTTLKLNTSCKDTPKKDGKSKKGKKNVNNVATVAERANATTEREELQRQSSERDSANHSPADVMLASPSLSSISDNHSEGSNDSGKGGSDVATPPPSRTPGTTSLSDEHPNEIYEFIIPQSLVGKLIGKNGASVSHIKEKSKANVVVRKHPADSKLKVCSIEGSHPEVEKALKMIRDKFPLKRFPEVTLEQVSFISQVAAVQLMPDHLYLKLVEGINNDTILSCMVSPNHLFLQQPTHPTFPSLNILTNYMNACYTELDSPMLPTPIPDNTVCAAFSVDSWYRAMVLSTDVESDTSYVKFLDYGGYAYVENSQLRQIRGDFMLLPFQAAECLLANVAPKGDDELPWADEAYSLVSDLTKGAIIYTQVIDYTDDGVPLVNCYVLLRQNQLVFLNEELVNHGYATWVYDEEATASLPETTEGAVGGALVA